MKAATALTKALSALARTRSGSAASAGPIPAPGTDPIALADAQLDLITRWGERSPAPDA